jgi:hypothetical protein
MSTSTAIDRQTSEALQSSIGGDVFVPGDHGFDEARQAWNLVADQRPAVVVLAGSAADVATRCALPAPTGCASPPGHRPRRRAAGAATSSSTLA